MIHAVIGAQFGDEGKGLLTDYLSDHHALVIRFNGGAQAGHTVVLPDGRRHEFHHFGAGCFKAACTLLSRFFIVNPLLYVREYHSPELAGIRRTTYIDERALVTTPIDMMLNALVEQKRGTARHGSCGVGINETVTRSAQEQYRVTVGDLRYNCDALLDDIIRSYAVSRAEELGVKLQAAGELLAIFARWKEDARFMFKTAFVIPESEALIAQSESVIFEGAQGLRLDEHAPGFPHVTRSRTGLTNVLALLRDASVAPELDVTYVTRAYVTRHGAGPLTGECHGHPYGWRGDETNITNINQGPLRYAPLDVDELRLAIHLDLMAAPRSIRAGLAITCLDQVPDGLAVAARTAAAVRLPLTFTSNGPISNHVTSYKEKTHGHSSTDRHLGDGPVTGRGDAATTPGL